MKDIFNLSEENISFLKDKKIAEDNIYKADLKKVQDQKKGYRSIIRFLPYFKLDGTLAETSAIEKHLHYFKSSEYPDLQGYYECGKNFPEINNGKCGMCELFFELDKSPDPVKKDRAKTIARTTRYYSYVLVLEDEQQPELVGKIMIFTYGFKIKEKIRMEATGEVTGKKCNPFDLAAGKDFYLVVKKVGDFPNYDLCQFDNNPSPIKINGKALPTVVDDSNGKTIIAPEFSEKLMKFLLSRTGELSDYSPKPLTDELRDKVEKIIALTRGSDINRAKQMVENSSSKASLDMFDEEVSTPKTAATNSGGKSLIDSFFDE